MANKFNPNPSFTVAIGHPVNPVVQRQPSSSPTYQNKTVSNEECKLCLLLILVLIGAALFGLAIYYGEDENQEISRLNVTYASLSYYNNNDLNLNHSSASLPLRTYYDIAFNFTMENPHQSDSFEYLDIQAQVLYFDSFLTDKESIPSFSLAEQASTFFRIEHLVRPKSELNLDMLEARETTGMLIFGIHVYWRTDLFDDYWDNYFAKCDDVRLVFGNATTTQAFMLGAPKQCNVVRTSEDTLEPKPYPSH